MSMRILNKKWELINYVSPPQKFPSFLTLVAFQSNSSKVLLVEDAVAFPKAVWREQVTLISLLVSHPVQAKLRYTGAFLPAVELLMKLALISPCNPCVPCEQQGIVIHCICGRDWKPEWDTNLKHFTNLIFLLCFSLYLGQASRC